MRSCREYRRSSRLRLIGNYGVVIGAGLLYTIFLNIVSAPLSIFNSLNEISGFIPLGGLVSLPFSVILSLVSILFSTGVNKIIYDVMHGEKADLMNIFYCFSHDPLKVIFTCLWMLFYLLPPVILILVCFGIFMALTLLSPGTLSIIIGVVILAAGTIAYMIWFYSIVYSMAMTFNVYYEHEELNARDLVRTSITLMKGHRLQLFKLHLSYLGYYLLGILSCGLALLWVTPNITGAGILFYRDLIEGDVINENINKPEESEEPLRSESVSVSSEEDISYHQDYWN